MLVFIILTIFFVIFSVYFAHRAKTTEVSFFDSMVFAILFVAVLVSSMAFINKFIEAPATIAHYDATKEYVEEYNTHIYPPSALEYNLLPEVIEINTQIEKAQHFKSPWIGMFYSKKVAQLEPLQIHFMNFDELDIEYD